MELKVEKNYQKSPRDKKIFSYSVAYIGGWQLIKKPAIALTWGSFFFSSPGGGQAISFSVRLISESFVRTEIWTVK